MKEQDYIYTIYEERSFSGAAKKLFISQPALSQMVKKVEKELGITIFDRTSVPLVLTDEGRIYLDAVEKIRQAERTLRDRLTDMSDLKIGEVTISGENFVSSFILPKIIMAFAKAHPGIAVKLVESNSPNLRQLLLTEETDLLIAHDFDPNFYESIPLFDERVMLAVPKSLPVNQGIERYAVRPEDIKSGNDLAIPAIDLRRFQNEEFLLLNRGNDMYFRAISLCHEAGFEPTVNLSLDQLITAYNLSNAGMGISFVTDVLIVNTAADGCFFYNISSPLSKRTMTVGYKKNRYLNRATKAFIDTALSTFRK